MPFTLNLTFGGLCMFVQFQDPDDPSRTGLYALMPSMKMAGMVHEPLLVHDCKYLHKTGRRVRNIDGCALRLRSSDASLPGAAVPLPKEIPRASLFGERAPDERWFTDTPAGALAARIHLDLGLEVTPHVNVVTMKVHHHGSDHDEQFVGQARLSFECDTVPLLVCGEELWPDDATNTMNLCFLNIPRNHLDRPQPGHKKGPAMHFDAYYNLLKPGGPRPLPKIPGNQGVGEEKRFDCEHPDGFAARPSHAVTLDVHSADFVDPYVCTLSSGCDPSDPRYPDC